MRLLHILPFLLLAATLSACRNDGDIGDLYGQWQLTEVQQAGASYRRDHLFLAFQSDCVFARIAGTDAHYTDQIVGSFVHQGDSLCLRFFLSDEADAVVQGYFTDGFRFQGTAPHQLRFGIRRLDASTLILSQGPDLWHFRHF